MENTILKITGYSHYGTLKAKELFVVPQATLSIFPFKNLELNILFFNVCSHEYPTVMSKVLLWPLRAIPNMSIQFFKKSIYYLTDSSTFGRQHWEILFSPHFAHTQFALPFLEGWPWWVLSLKKVGPPLGSSVYAVYDLKPHATPANMCKEMTLQSLLTEHYVKFLPIYLQPEWPSGKRAGLVQLWQVFRRRNYSLPWKLHLLIIPASPQQLKVHEPGPLPSVFLCICPSPLQHQLFSLNSVEPKRHSPNFSKNRTSSSWAAGRERCWDMPIM